MSIWTILAILMWVALGAAIALVCVVFIGRRRFKRCDPNVFGMWLGRECEVLKGDGWHRCIVVAVSHKGAIAVRNAADGSGRHAKWIGKERVPERVRWEIGGAE